MQEVQKKTKIKTCMCHLNLNIELDEMTYSGIILLPL